MFTQGLAVAQCPAVGQDTTCRIIITVTNSGATINLTGQGPYDGVEDTLIGVVNKSRLPVSSLGLKSSLTIFGFDGDGIDTFGIAGNARDNTGYGGPNAFFTNISADQTSGTVNFITPIAANGGTAFFSLEEALTSATACSTLINHAVPKPPGGGTQISTTFTPNLGFTLAQAAQLCGFIEFDWQQTITSLPLPSPFFALAAPPRCTRLRLSMILRREDIPIKLRPMPWDSPFTTISLPQHPIRYHSQRIRRQRRSLSLTLLPTPACPAVAVPLVVATRRRAGASWLSEPTW